MKEKMKAKIPLSNDESSDLERRDKYKLSNSLQISKGVVKKGTFMMPNSVKIHQH